MAQGDGFGHCSVCGVESPVQGSIRDQQGRLVCRACVEEARRVLDQRALNKRRAEDLARKQAEVVKAEQDNSIVLALREDAMLESIAHRCPACGKFMDLAVTGCITCGTAAIPDRKKRHRTSVPISAAGAVPGAILPTLDPRLERWVPTGLAATFAAGLGFGWVVPWIWTSTLMGLFCFASVIAGLVVYACWQRSARLGAAMAVCSLAGLVASLLAPRLGTPSVAWICRGIAAFSVVALSVWGVRWVADRPARAMWWIAAAATCVVLGRAGYTAIGTAHPNRAGSIAPR